MLRSKALDFLDPTHARALQLAEDGLDTEEIADRLALDPSAVGPVLVIARGKLAALEAIEDRAVGRVQSADTTIHHSDHSRSNS